MSATATRYEFGRRERLTALVADLLALRGPLSTAGACWLAEFAQERSCGWYGVTMMRVDGEGPVGPGDHRVEVEVGDFGQVVGEHGDPQQDVAQRGSVGGGSAANAISAVSPAAS